MRDSLGHTQALNLAHSRAITTHQPTPLFVNHSASENNWAIGEHNEETPKGYILHGWVHEDRTITYPKR